MSMPQTTLTKEKSDDAAGVGLSASSTAAKLRSDLKAVLSSTMMWTLLWLFALDLALAFAKPLHAVEIGGYIPQDRNPARVKLERLTQPWCNPDVVVIGSSLSQASFSCADALVQKRRAPSIGYELYTYGKSVYLEDKLGQLTGKRHSVLDLSLGGCMASDAYFMLKKVASERTNIRMLILPIAPRDFYDNASASDPEMSPVATFLRKKSIAALLSPAGSAQEKFENGLSFLWRYFDVRADYQHLLQLLGCQVLGRAPDIYVATHIDEPFSKYNRVDFAPKPRSAGEVLPLSLKQADAKKYFGQYNPYRQDRLQGQFQYLEKTLQLCREKSITPIVVDMPLSELNRRQMSAALSAQYQSNLLSVCRKNSVRLIRLQGDADFSDNDFRDSCHLVGTGGKKVIDKIVNVLAGDRALTSGLTR